MNLAKLFKDTGGLTDYNATVCRIVETQEYAATTSLVDDLEEQAILEHILDEFKPQYAQDTKHLHYLIATPFRYPPLKYGSRFGAITEPSYFYASETVETCLAEAAFYRFYLLDGTAAPFPNMIQSEHSIFFVRALSRYCLDLTQISDKLVQQQLTDPCSYAATQTIGQYARQQMANTLRYFSARSSNQGINVAIANHSVIQSKKPEDKVEYICQLNPESEQVKFSHPRGFPITFAKEQFLVDGKMPTLG